jgi:hypothetical protein
MTSREDYQERLKAQLIQWDEQLGAWETAARIAGHETRVEMERQVGIMKSRLDDMVFRAGLLKDASAEAWQDIARGADEARKNLHDAFDKARTHFKDV